MFDEHFNIEPIFGLKNKKEKRTENMQVRDTLWKCTLFVVNRNFRALLLDDWTGGIVSFLQ